MLALEVSDDTNLYNDESKVLRKETAVTNRRCGSQPGGQPALSSFLLPPHPRFFPNVRGSDGRVRLTLRSAE